MSPVSLQELRAALAARGAGQVYVVMRGSEAFDPIEQVARRMADLYEPDDPMWGGIKLSDSARAFAMDRDDYIVAERTLEALADYFFGDTP